MDEYFDEISAKALVLSNSSAYYQRFNFPSETKTICHQYLDYFGQFLEDLGEPAESTIEYFDFGTFIKVVPKSKHLALERIHSLLVLYLNIPRYKISEQLEPNSDISIKQLALVVEHLNKQLELYHLNLSELVESSNNSSPNNSALSSKDNAEEIIPGMISVDKFRMFGVELNIAEVLRRLKRRLRKDKK